MEVGVVHVISSSSNVRVAFGLCAWLFFFFPSLELNVSFSSVAVKDHN